MSADNNEIHLRGIDGDGSFDDDRENFFQREIVSRIQLEF